MGHYDKSLELINSALHGIKIDHSVEALLLQAEKEIKEAWKTQKASLDEPAVNIEALKHIKLEAENSAKQAQELFVPSWQLEHVSNKVHELLREISLKSSFSAKYAAEIGRLKRTDLGVGGKLVDGPKFILPLVMWIRIKWRALFCPKDFPLSYGGSGAISWVATNLWAQSIALKDHFFISMKSSDPAFFNILRLIYLLVLPTIVLLIYFRIRKRLIEKRSFNHDSMGLDIFISLLTFIVFAFLYNLILLPLLNLIKN